MSTNESLAKVQTLYDRYTGLINEKKNLIQKRDNLLVQAKMAEEQLVAVYGPNWQTKYEADLKFFEGLEASLASAVNPAPGAV